MFISPIQFVTVYHGFPLARRGHAILAFCLCMIWVHIQAQSMCRRSTCPPLNAVVKLQWLSRRSFLKSANFPAQSVWLKVKDFLLEGRRKQLKFRRRASLFRCFTHRIRAAAASQQRRITKIHRMDATMDLAMSFSCSYTVSGKPP